MKAIPGIYGGVKMRSQLETRWAQFFDDLGLEWDYEPRVFKFNGVWYLPDFWLPGVNAWVEAKGVFDNKSRVKVYNLIEAANKVGQTVWLAQDAPMRRGSPGFDLRKLRIKGSRMDTSFPSRTCFANCSTCGNLVLFADQKGYEQKCWFCKSEVFTNKYYPKNGRRR